MGGSLAGDRQKPGLFLNCLTGDQFQSIRLGLACRARGTDRLRCHVGRQNFKGSVGSGSGGGDKGEAPHATFYEMIDKFV